MKRLPLIIVVVAVLIGVGWFAWNEPGTDADGASPATEVPVHVGEIIRTTLRGYVTAYGAVEPEPAGERPAASVRLAPAVPGVVAAVHAAEGQQVEKGSVLFELDSRAADVAVDFARQARQRETQLMDAGGTSQKRLQEAQQQLDSALVQQALLRVASPLAGTVTRVNVRPGEAVDLSTVLAEIVDVDRLVVNAGVPDAEVDSLAPGQLADVFLETGVAATTGTLSYVGTDVDTSTGAVPLRISLPAGSGLRPGQFVGVHIVNAEHADCFAVPVESVTTNDEGVTVIAIVKDGIATQLPVTTGLRDAGLVEIVADELQPGMTVVTEGAYALPKETQVRVLGD